MARDAPVKLLLLLLLVLAVAAAGLTRYPEAAIYRRAERLPLVGEWVAKTRARYLAAPPSAAEDAAAAAPETVVRIVPPAADPSARPRLWVAEGSALRAAPDPDAPAVVTVGATSNLKSYGRSADWVELEYHGVRGWLESARLPPQPELPLGSEPEPPRPLPGREPDPERLALARELLADRERVVPLAGYTLYTDAEPGGGPVRALGRLAAELDRSYTERYGVAPIARPVGAVVLYRRETDYRRLAAAEREIGRLPSSGYAARGVVAIYLGGRPEPAVLATCVHELTHLLNRRALGPALPPWLEEGLAGDLAALLVGAEAGESKETPGSRVIARGALLEDRLPGLAELLALDAADFLAPLRNELHYAESFLLVRYLLDGGEPALAAGLRRHLAGIAAGGPADGEALRRALGRSWPELDRGFRAWLGQAGPRP